MSTKKNISSGAQKAEALADNTAPEKSVKETKKPVKSVKKTGAAKKTAAAKPAKPAKKKQAKSKKVLSEKKQKKIAAREAKKVEIARIRAEKKQKRLEKKLEAKQKRLDAIAAAKKARAERKEKRRERRDMLKHETKKQRIERKKAERTAKVQARVAKREAAAADRRAKREHRLKVRAEKRAEKNDKRHAPGFGGWLAAVISLGVTTLALGTMLTFGWINMNGMQSDMASVHTQSLYELNSIIDNLDANLAKARVSASENERVRLLSDIATESQMAETVLERLPVGIQLTDSFSSFVNKMGDSAKSMLYAVADGKELTGSQIATIEHMYSTNRQFKEAMNEMCAGCTEKNMLAALKGKKGNMFASGFGEIANNQIETPKEINDGPFAENVKKSSPKNLDGLEEITAERAEELAKSYFADYGVNGAKCTGETVANELTLFNVTLKTKQGDMWAQLSKQGGKVVEFNSYKDCSDNNFSVERCIDIAQDFLEDLGYTGMKAVWTSENGTTCNLNFTYVDDGVVVYPDMIKVKVCEERGIVTGMEGLAYVLNHTEREIGSASVSKSEAAEKLSAGFENEGARLCLIPVDGEEVLCYEFYGNYGGNDYYIYIDANTGKEVQIFTVIGTMQGKALI